jgi:hypothetical protein
VVVLPFDRDEIDERTIKILITLLDDLHRSPRFVPYFADFDRKQGYRGNSFIAKVSMKDPFHMRLEPTVARFLDVLLEMAASSASRIVALSSVRDEVISRRALWIGSDRNPSVGLETSPKLFDQINRAFEENMRDIGVVPYEILVKDPNLKTFYASPRHWKQFEEARYELRGELPAIGRRGT